MSAAEDQQPRGRLLVADDEESVRRILERALTSAGYEVTLAANGTQAQSLLAARANEFDVAVLDIMMPGISGLDLASWISQHVQDDAAPRVLLASALGSSHDIQAGLRHGADDYVPKPLRVHELRARVGRLARLRQAERALVRANAHMRDELACASRIQAGLLPPSPLRGLRGVSAAFAYQPCEGLAGDFLDAQAVGRNHIAFFVADVCGHGVAASLVATWAATLLSPARALAPFGRPGDAARNPAEVCATLDQAFVERGIDSYLTLAYCVLNVQTGQVDYCCGGHPPPVIIRKSGTVERLSHGGGPPVGMGLNLGYQTARAHLAPDDRLFLFTDGLPEARVDSTPLGDDRLIELLGTREPSLQSLVDSIVYTTAKRAKPSDDLTLLAVALNSSPTSAER